MFRAWDLEYNVGKGVGCHKCRVQQGSRVRLFWIPTLTRAVDSVGLSEVLAALMIGIGF